ncbi:MAG: rRNA maturation RNase YbeY [Candidatus Paceibacterota bacterium]|jgi:probable rRNA maturation factor
MKKDGNFIIINKTKGKLPSLPFLNMKNYVLGEDYSLSLVIVGKKKIRDLNKKYRGIDSSTDILSFPLEKKLGEIFICQDIAREKAPLFEREYNNFLSYLFIHGLVHLLGYDHGIKMEEVEIVNRKHFQI